MVFLSYLVWLHTNIIIYKWDNSLLLPISTNLSLPLDITLVISLGKGSVTLACYYIFVNRLMSYKKYCEYRRIVLPPISLIPNPLQNGFCLGHGPFFVTISPEVFAFLFLAPSPVQSCDILSWQHVTQN